MASGVPQARWRLISQSGRVSTMPRMRFLPLSGKNCVASMAERASWRRLPSSSASPMAMNHCGVLRKITGALERHECG